MVLGAGADLLISISLGAVLCGAMTYIGNGPNFMVKSVADDAGVKTPSFLGYVRSAFVYLAPVLLAMMLLFIADPWWAKALGALTAVLVLARAFRHATSAPPKVLGRGGRRDRHDPTGATAQD